MNRREWLVFIVKSIFAGACIAFAAMLYLYAQSLLITNDAIGKTLTGLLFGFGLYFVIVMDYKLFTGMVAGLTDMKPKQWLWLVVCYVFNTLGVLFVVVLCYLMKNSVSAAVIEKAVAVTEGKLSNGLWGAFISAAFCGMMITFAVKSHQNARNKGLSGTLGILFPVLMFVYMGFEHCIANQAYIFLALLGKANVELVDIFVFSVVTAFGNVIGGVFFPLLLKGAEAVKIRAEKRVETADNTENNEGATVSADGGPQESEN